MKEHQGRFASWKKQLILLVAAIGLPVLFFLLPPNKLFLERIQDYWQDYVRQRHHLDLEYRKIHRYDSSYVYSKQIAAFFEQKQQPVLVLVPATRYFKQYHINYEVPEPTVFYYYTSLKTIRPADAGAEKANWFVSVRNGKLAFDSVTSHKALTDTIAYLKKIDPSL
jgi:hypothetical protein